MRAGTLPVLFFALPSAFYYALHIKAFILESWLAGSWMDGWMEGKTDRQVDRWGRKERQ